jgi:hypothetical protein
MVYEVGIPSGMGLQSGSGSGMKKRKWEWEVAMNCDSEKWK